MNGKYIQVKRILEIIKDLTANSAQIESELQTIEQQLVEFDPYSKEIEQNQQTIDQISKKLNIYRNEIQNISKSFVEFEEFIAPEYINQLKELELRVEKLLDKMEEQNRNFYMAKAIRNEYLINTEKVHYWINNTEERLKNHYIEPLEFKKYIHNSFQERPTVAEWFDVAIRNGQSILQSTHDQREVSQIQNTLEHTREQLNHVFALLEDQKSIIDNVVDSWSKFMELYQIIINWASEKKIFVGQDVKLNNQYEAQLKLNEYSVSSLFRFVCYFLKIHTIFMAKWLRQPERYRQVVAEI